MESEPQWGILIVSNAKGEQVGLHTLISDSTSVILGESARVNSRAEGLGYGRYEGLGRSQTREWDLDGRRTSYETQVLEHEFEVKHHASVLGAISEDLYTAVGTQHGKEALACTSNHTIELNSTCTISLTRIRYLCHSAMND